MQSPPATTNENEGQRKGKRSERKDQPAQSDKQAGKKRKMDERNDDGLSKKERIKAMARQTPWSQEVDWERCKNPAEM